MLHIFNFFVRRFGPFNIFLNIVSTIKILLNQLQVLSVYQLSKSISVMLAQRQNNSQASSSCFMENSSSEVSDLVTLKV